MARSQLAFTAADLLQATQALNDADTAWNKYSRVSVPDSVVADVSDDIKVVQEKQQQAQRELKKLRSRVSPLLIRA